MPRARLRPPASAPSLRAPPHPRRRPAWGRTSGPTRSADRRGGSFDPRAPVTTSPAGRTSTSTGSAASIRSIAVALAASTRSVSPGSAPVTRSSAASTLSSALAGGVHATSVTATPDARRSSANRGSPTFTTRGGLESRSAAVKADHREVGPQGGEGYAILGLRVSGRALDSWLFHAAEVAGILPSPTGRGAGGVRGRCRGFSLRGVETAILPRFAPIGDPLPVCGARRETAAPSMRRLRTVRGGLPAATVPRRRTCAGSWNRRPAGAHGSRAVTDLRRVADPAFEDPRTSGVEPE